MAIGTILGGPIAGRLTDRAFLSQKGIALWALSLYGLSLFPLAGLIMIEGPFWYGLIFFCLGFFGSSGMVSIPMPSPLPDGHLRHRDRMGQLLYDGWRSYLDARYGENHRILFQNQSQLSPRGLPHRIRRLLVGNCCQHSFLRFL
jgi:hypothetical protein